MVACLLIKEQKFLNNSAGPVWDMVISTFITTNTAAFDANSASSAERVPCVTDEDCSLNGVCTSGACVCDPGWTTLPFGLNGAMSPGCGYLDFDPSPITTCGPACAFHGGPGGVDMSTTSWGGSVNRNPVDGKYWMFAAEMSHHCTLSQWTTNSQVVSAVSDTPMGPYVRQEVTIPPWSHNPQAVVAPDGTWVIFTLGPGFGQKPQVDCDSPLAADHSPAPDGVGVNFTLHSAPSPHGPWVSTTLSPIGWNASWTLQNPGNWNPAPVFLGDGSIRVMAHTDWGPWAGETILEAPSWKGPYTVRGGDEIDHCDYCEEDPFMWQDRRGPSTSLVAADTGPPAPAHQHLTTTS